MNFKIYGGWVTRDGAAGFRIELYMSKIYSEQYTNEEIIDLFEVMI